tara:strand:- start:7460 stop:10066 length:2607 start_codon:yes stop_codon:yes gene_type:complete
VTSDQISLLPTGVNPQRYDLTLAPDLKTFTFQGEAQIHLEIQDAVDQITLNAVEIEIKTAEITADQENLIASNVTYDENAQTATFKFDEKLQTGNAVLHIEFSGILNDQLHGFYRSSYVDVDGQEKWMATTQLEATDARRAFPSWDEPSYKSTFNVTLIIPQDLVAISNMTIADEVSVDGETKKVVFNETPRMSTYLLAFIVGDFESIEAQGDNDTVVRVWATRGKSEQGRFALETSVRLLEYFNGYFGIPYPLEKLDHIAIPDFAAGAMENWGAVTYREIALLADPANSAAGTRQRIAEIISHEMAHMWFGDLVTMEWWNDLWLNESFASWMGDKAIDALFPEWDMWTQFIVNDTNAGLGLDGLKNSHPIEADVRDPAQIQELFDAISYSKGGAILRMLEQYLGESVFQSGIHDYLDSHSYENAKTTDLWDALEKASGQPVTSIMGTWTQQMGYPVLSTEIDRDSDRVDVKVSQRRFVYDQTDGDVEDSSLWQVPVSVVGAGGDGIDRSLLTEKDGVIHLQEAGVNLTSEGWVKLNAGTTGFYRVNYTENEWEKFIPAIENLELSASDRLGLQGDAYALARSGILPATKYLSMAGAFTNEQEYAIWADLAGNLRQMESLLGQEEYLEDFRSFGRALFGTIARQVGWDPKADEGHLRVLLRSVVLGQSGGYGDEAVIAEAQSRFNEYLKDPEKLDPNLRAIVYGIVAQNGDERVFDTIRDLANQATLHEEKLRLQGSLSRFEDPLVISKGLNLTLSDEVRSQDTVMLLTAFAGNSKARDLTWKFIKDNWSEFDRRYGGGGFAIMRLVSVTGAFTHESDRQDVESFFAKHPAPAAERTIQQSLERINLNIRWINRNREELSGWLRDRTG